MGVEQAREPGLSLETIIARLRAVPKTAETELALADFLMLPQHEQMEVLFLGLVMASASSDWAVQRIQELLRK